MDDKGKKQEAKDDDVPKITGVPGISRSVLEILPELWEQQQYDDEYDFDSFLSTLKADNLWAYDFIHQYHQWHNTVITY